MTNEQARDLMTRALLRALPTPRLSAKDYEIRDVPISLAQALVKAHHYAGGGSNTRIYTHGLFRKGHPECLGVAWWLPPTKPAALATYPDNWRGVLSLSRLVIVPGAPRNAASFLIAGSIRRIDRGVWPCLVTYADEWRGHTGAIYRATNWTYVGKTARERTYVVDGRMVARKAGQRTRTHAEMLALGAQLVGTFSKHKYVMTP